MLERREMQYLYNEGDLYYFMDNETYEQIPISKDTLGDDFRFVKENENVKVLSYKGNVFAVEPPLFVELVITETEPGVKGNTATNVLKPATVETGAVVKVPISSSRASASRSIPAPVSIWVAAKSKKVNKGRFSPSFVWTFSSAGRASA